MWSQFGQGIQVGKGIKISWRSRVREGSWARRTTRAVWGVESGRRLKSAGGDGSGRGGGEHAGQEAATMNVRLEKGASPEDGSPALSAPPGNQEEWKEGEGRGGEEEVEYQPATDAGFISNYISIIIEKGENL